MKLTFKPSPNYRSPQSTTGIMRDLTVCLLAITIFSVAYYSATLGASAGLRVIILMVTSVLSALVTEAIYFKASKQDIKEGILSSYGWVTAMILTLISSINVSPYALAICTVIAIVFGKLVFGGFGQNIFNPAAFGEAVLMNSFAGSNIDLMSSTTPTVAMNKFSWLGTSSAVSGVISQYSGLGKMFLGLYPSTIGSTCAVLLIICLVFLVVRDDIDWQTSVFYIGTVFVVTLIIGLVHGLGISYALVNVLAGGVLFGGVFMVTDPVTTPVTLPGKIVYGVGAGCFTVLFRLRSNMSDGVLYSILLMNMLTPSIDKLFDGNQIKDAAKIRNKTAIISAICLVIIVAVGSLTKVSEATSSTDSGNSSSSSDSSAATTSGDATCVDNGDGSYACSADGFNGEKLTATITVEDGKVTAITDMAGNNGDGIGDDWFDDASELIGVSSADEIDTISGATFTSSGVKAMINAALNPSASTSTETSTDKASSTTATEGCTDNGDGTYACSAEGFNGENLTATITVEDGKVTAITDMAGNNGDGIGDDWFDDASELIGVSSADEIDTISGATYTSTGVKTMIEAALNAANGETVATEEESTGDDACVDNGDGSYACSAEGFNGENLTATITVEDGKVTAITDMAGNNGDGIGDDWFDDASELIGVSSADEIDTISGATYTSTGVKTMIEAALSAASK